MKCRHFGECGGCGVPGVPYSGQLETKQRRLQAWFPDVALLPIVPSPVEDGFRHKVAFVFDPRSASPHIVMGHYRAGSTRVVEIAECPVHSSRGNQLAFALRDRLARARIPAGILRHVLVRTSEARREAVMMLVVTTNHPSLRAPVRAFLESTDRPDGFFINLHDRPGPYMVGPTTLRLAGRGHVGEELLGARFLVSPTAFFQTNVRAARELLGLVLREASGARRVLDLYSGGGLFAIPLARQGARVVAVEENRDAVRDARANLRVNGIAPDRVRLVAARAEAAMPRLGRSRVDAVVMDPPRQGCPDSVIDAVCHLEAARVVYVSCNPERLTAERHRFRRGGYGLSRLQAVDMFPHTTHIEAVAVFERQS